MDQAQSDDLDTAELLAGRHPSVSGVARFVVEVNPNLPPHLSRVAAPFAVLARLLLGELDDGPELTAALRKLLEAKDCAVRAAL